MNIITLIKTIYYKLINKKKDLYLKGLIDQGLRLGRDVDIIESCFFDPSHCYLISIGDNCTICPNVRLISHDASSKKILGYTKIGRIDIRANCFIGDSSIILPAVVIGPNAIVGAGSVITKDVPPNSVVAGNPARIIASVDEYITKLKSLSNDCKIFNEDYFIENIDENKRKEMIKTIGNKIGFIV